MPRSSQRLQNDPAMPAANRAKSPPGPDGGT